MLYKRSGRLQDAHTVFASNYDLIKDNPKAVHEYAQTKQRLAASLSNKDMPTKQRLTKDAVELLRRAIQLSNDNIRNAWCYFDLAKALTWLQVPATEVTQAYDKAIELLPDEPRFQDSYQAWRQSRTN